MPDTLWTHLIDETTRIRFEPECESPRETYDTSLPGMETECRQIEAGDLLWVCAVHEKQCAPCGSWHREDSIGSIAATDRADAEACALTHFT